MILREATLKDIDLLSYWDTKPHVIDCGGADDAMEWRFEFTRGADWQFIAIAEEQGRPIGVLQIINPAREITRYWGEIENRFRAIDIWIGEESDLGKGYGEEMMRLALIYCFDQDAVEAVLIDPLLRNHRAIKFYERLGFRHVEERRFGEDDCAVMTMTREDWKESDLCRNLT